MSSVKTGSVSTTGLPSDEDCDAEIEECGVENIAKVELRQPDAVLHKSSFLRAVELEPEPSVVTSQQLSAGAGRRPPLRQTRQAEESSAATPPFKRTAYVDEDSHPQKYKTLTKVGIHRLQILCIILCYFPLLQHACCCCISVAAVYGHGCAIVDAIVWAQICHC